MVSLKAMPPLLRLEFSQLPQDKGRKVLKGIVEYRYDPRLDQVSAHRICKYDFTKEQWFWRYDLGEDKEELAVDNPEKLEKIHWLPPSCAYRRLKEGKNLPSWHYLNTGSRQSVIKAKKSAAGRCISELDVAEEDIEDYVVRWVR